MRGEEGVPAPQVDAPPRPEVAVGAVVVRDGSLLLVQRANPPGAGRWSLPGGRVEPGETLHEAVRREVAEETGLVVVPGELCGIAERSGRDHHFVILDFFATPVGGTAAPADDAADLAWWTPVQLRERRDELVDGLAAWLTDHGVPTLLSAAPDG